MNETVKKLLDAEADQFSGVNRYARLTDHLDAYSDSYGCGLKTKTEKISLKVPRFYILQFTK